MSGNKKLRRELGDAQSILLPIMYLEKLDALDREFSHSVVRLEEGREQIRRFNCFAYALGVWDSPTYQALIDVHAKDALTVLNSVVVSDWIRDGILKEIRREDALADDIVAYFHKKQLMHFARLGGGKVLRSKWGGNEVHEHGLWEVPAEYGDQVRYFRKPDAEAVLTELCRGE